MEAVGQGGLRAQGRAEQHADHRWQEFATGEYAFGENGTWQLGNAKKAGFPYGIINIPTRSGGGAAPVPTGGEFVTVPVQKDTARYDVSKKIVACLTSDAEPAAPPTPP